MPAAPSALSPVAGGAQPELAVTPSLSLPVSGETAALDDYEALPVAKLLPLLGKAMDRPHELPAILPLSRYLGKLACDVDLSTPKRFESAVLLLRLWLVPGVDVLVRTEDGLDAVLDLCRTCITDLDGFATAADLLRQLARVVDQVPLDDKLVLQLEYISLQALQLTNASAACRSLQTAAIFLAQTLFDVYPVHRSLILDDILSDLTKFPALREFHVASFDQGSGPDICVQMLSALVLSLVQVCHGSSHEEQQQDESKSASDYFVARLLARCNDDVKEFSPILSRFVDDLLSVALAPELPAAEVVISTCINLFTKVLNGSKVTAPLLALLVDILGKIFLTCHSHWLLNAKTDPVGAMRRSGTPDDQDEVIACPCGKGFEGRFMISCRRCQRWYHGACVGVNEMDRGLDDLLWYCDECAVLAHATAQTHRGQADRDVVHGHLAHRSKIDLNGGLHTSALKFYKPLGNSSGNLAASQMLLGRAAASLAVLRLHCTLPAGMSAPAPRTLLLNVICKHASSSPQSSIRARALKAVAHLVQVDATLLREELVQHAIEARLSDEAVSVRDAVLELLGKCGAADKALLEPYKSLILDRVQDQGLTVRKRAVKLVRDTMLQPLAPDLVHIVAKLAGRLDDAKEDDTVKELVVKALGDLWFGGCIDGLTECAGRPWLVSLVRKAVQGNPCGPLVESLVIKVHQFESLRVLKILAQADATLVVPNARHVARLLDEADLDAKLAADACEICTVCLSNEQSRLDLAALEVALERILYSQPPSVMPAAVSCLRALFEYNGSKQAVTRALAQFAPLLDKAEFANLSPRAKSDTQRSLLCVGLLTKNGFAPAAVVSSILPFCSSAVKDETIRKRALQALDHVCSVFPHSLVHGGQSAVQLSQAIRDPSPLIRAQALACFNDLLESAARDKDDARCSLLTCFVQSHTQAIMGALGESQKQSRVCLAACTLVRTMLVMGAVHHQQCIEPLVRACGQAAAHEAALGALVELHERHKMPPSLVAKGVLACSGDASLLRPLYSRFVQPDRSGRYRFLELCVEKLLGGSDVQKALESSDVDAAWFIGRALTCFEYASFDEVLLVITLLRRRAMLRSCEPLDRLKASMGAYAKALKKGMPWTDPEPTIDSRLSQDAIVAQVSTVALRVAHELVQSYRVVRARLEEFVVPATSVAGEKLLPAPLPEPPSDFAFLGTSLDCASARGVAASLNELNAAIKQHDGPIAPTQGSKPLIQRSRPTTKRARRGPSSEDDDDEDNEGDGGKSTGRSHKSIAASVTRGPRVSLRQRTTRVVFKEVSDEDESHDQEQEDHDKDSDDDSEYSEE